MKYGIKVVRHELTVFVDLTDVPEMTRKHGSTLVQPVRARIDSTDGHTDRVTVYSQRRLKSGALGEDVWHDGWSAEGWDENRRPGWLDDLVRHITTEIITPSWMAHQAALGVTA